MRTNCAEQPARAARWIAAMALCALLAACGGGGSGGGVPLVGLPVASGGSAPASGSSSSGSSTGTGSSGSTSSSSTSNVLAISVDSGPAGSTDNINTPYVSVTVCPPGGSSCQQIDHVIVDTGSYGLRLVASALQNPGALPLQTLSGNGMPAECALFASGYAWGSVRLADVGLAGAKAPSVPVQVIGDSSVPTAPDSCTAGGAPMNTVAALGGNGVLGVGVFRQDCGSACAANAVDGTYYQCPSSGSCTAIAMPLAQQVANPVALLPADNNGVLIQLPSIGANGATNVAGTLVLGIGTRDNNAMGSAQVYGLNSATGTLTTTLDNQSYVNSFVDSGSNGLYFTTSSLPQCAASSNAPGFYCPSSTQSLSAVNTGSNGTTGSIAFQVANASDLVSKSPNATAFNDLAAPFSVGGGFDWGLPFFFGRQVFTAFEDASTPGGNGPYVAY